MNRSSKAVAVVPGWLTKWVTSVLISYAMRNRSNKTTGEMKTNRNSIDLVVNLLDRRPAML